MIKLFILILSLNIACAELFYGSGQEKRWKWDTKQMKFENRTGKNGLLQYGALNASHLRVFWTQSFNLYMNVVLSVNLYNADRVITATLGQAQPPFDDKSIILTNRPMNLCLQQTMLVTVRAKEEYKDKEWYKPYIMQTTIWYPPSFLKVYQN